MTKEKEKKVIERVEELNNALAKLYLSLWVNELNDPAVLKATHELVKESTGLLDTLEDLDLEKVELPNVDELFQDHPVTDYINAVYNHALNEDVETQKEVVVAAKKLAEHQQSEDIPECQGEEFDDIPTIYEFVKERDNQHQAEIQEHLDLIEIALEDETEFDEEDIELMRYFFKHNSRVNAFEIDELSDRAVEMAWKARLLKVGQL